MMMKLNGHVVSDETIAYLTTAMWAETVSLPVAEEELVDGCMDVDEDHPLHGIEECTPLDDHFELEDLSDESILAAQKDVEDFFGRVEDEGLMERAGKFADDDRIAHDFWLTRNHHGAGFWDGDYGDIGDRLTEIAQEWGAAYLYLGDDGKVHLSSG
jgi:hypothetical protein